MNLQVFGLTAFSRPVCIGSEQIISISGFIFTFPVEQVIQVAVAKEVGVGNPAEQNDHHPD
jgi:hypothetical protein